MGIPLYGQSFTLASRKDHGLNSKTYGGASAGKFTRARGFLSYYEVIIVFFVCRKFNDNRQHFLVHVTFKIEKKYLLSEYFLP